MARLLFFLLPLMLLGCMGDVTCDSDHESVVLAKSLSDDRLAKFYRDSEALLRTETGYDFSPIPAAFGDLEPIYIKRLGEHEILVKLAGCFDHGVILWADTRSGQVAVRYGEGPTQGEAILWTSGSSYIEPVADVRELPFDDDSATEGCTRLNFFFSGNGVSQEEARTKVRDQVSEAGGNAVVFVSGSVELDPDTREIASIGESAVGYQCDD